MAIQISDIMDFGNGIIGDDTFDVWRKKTNRIKVDLDSINTTLTGRLDALDAGGLGTDYIPKDGAATAVSTELSFSSLTTFTNNVSVNGGVLSGSANKITSTPEFESSTQLTSSKVKAISKLILGAKEYSVPNAPAINNAVLVGNTGGGLSWQNPATVFESAGGLQQTTTVFEEVMPLGSVVALAGDTNDTNFLYCNGEAVPGGKSGEYGDLFDIIGYDYGGSGNTFNLPDYRGRVAVGAETGSGMASLSGWPLSNDIGSTGGTSSTSTDGTALTIDQIPAHRHEFRDNAGHQYFAFNDSNRGDAGSAANRGTDAVNIQEQGDINQPNTDSAIGFTTYTGGGADGGIHGGSTAADDLSGLSGTSTHSHTINAQNRVQPYVTVKWFIKAKKNSKVDFTIRLDSDSGLAATDRSVSPNNPITDIKPIDGIVALKTQVDGTSITINGNNQLGVKDGPTITGTITANKLSIVDSNSISRNVNNGSLQIRGGNSFSSGSSNTGGTRMLLFGHEHDNHAKQFYVDSALHHFRTYDAKNLFVINENGRIYAPRTTNANINDQGDQSIITKKYLESVFNLDGGVLTIDLDPADPT